MEVDAACTTDGGNKLSEKAPVIMNAARSLATKLPVLLAAVFTLFVLSGGMPRLPHALRWFYVPVRVPSFVPGMSTSFGDTRTVTHSIDALHHGEDPYVVRKYDPWLRVYNYPPVWLSLRYLGIDSRSTNVLGVLLGCLTGACFWLLFSPRRLVSGLLVFLAGISPAVVFAVERGNIDQVIFFLLVVTMLAIAGKSEPNRKWAAGLMTVCLTVLKVFPIVCAVVLLRTRRQVALVCGTAVAAFAALLLTSGAKLRILLKNTPLDTQMSFGTWPVWFSLHGLLLRSYPPVAQRKYSVLLAVFVACVAAFVSLRFRRQFTRFLPVLRFESALGGVAVCCLAMFCFVFAAGSSYTYRLLFLVGPIALLLFEFERRGDACLLPAAALFVAYLWRPTGTHHLLDLFCFAVAAAWLGPDVAGRLANHGVPKPERT